MAFEPPQAVIDELRSSGWLETVHWYAEVDSTSSVARRAIEDPSVTLPALFVAERQTAGRGRNHRSWWSPAGCLMFTLAIDGGCLPDEPNEWSQLALVCGMAVANVAGHFVDNHKVQLKWPNDVYVSGKKVAGILIESAAPSSIHATPQPTAANPTASKPTASKPTASKPTARPNWLIGIGLNVNFLATELPPELAAKATCLSTCAGRSLDPHVALVELTQQLQQQLAQWRSGQRLWLDAWRERCLLSGKTIRVQIDPQRQLSGTCDGVDVAGRLILRSDMGVHILATGEVLAWH